MSSKRRIRRKQCEGKVRHASRDAAITAVRQMARRRDVYLVPYRCQFCKGWHIGHPNSAIRNAMREGGRG